MIQPTHSGPAHILAIARAMAVESGRRVVVRGYGRRLVVQPIAPVRMR